MKDIAQAIQPVIDEWMEGDHGGVIYTKELTDLIVEALTLKHPVALYNAGYEAGQRAALAPDERPCIKCGYPEYPSHHDPKMPQWEDHPYQADLRYPPATVTYR